MMGIVDRPYALREPAEGASRQHTLLNPPLRVCDEQNGSAR